jgi:excisionase family DNA binding protein
MRKTIDRKGKTGTMTDMSTVPCGNLISVAEAAKRLSISYVQVGNHIRAKRLPATRIGRAYVIDERMLAEFDKKRRRPGNPNFVKKCS